MDSFFSNRYFFLFVFPVVFLCCSETKSTQEEIEESHIWQDQTNIYLPETAEWTNRVEVADVNQDGLVDLIFANGGNYSEPGNPEPSRVFINQGPDKEFKEATSQVFSDLEFLSRVIKTADLNQDGYLDILVGTTYQTQSELFFGAEDLSFTRATDHLPQKLASIGDLEFGDADLDGDLDIILADWGAGSNMNNSGARVMLWLNDGNGKFTDVTKVQMPDLLIQFSWDLEFFDFDNDFDLDIAVSCKRCPTGRIYENDGKGFFTDKRMLPAYTNNYEFEPMDLNQDGFLDLVTVNDGEIVDGKSWSRREHIFINDSAQRFSDQTQYLWKDEDNIGEDDNNVAFLDYDSDGDPDFILSSLTGDDRLLINDGQGKFSLRKGVLSGEDTPLTLSLVFADINNDHKMDVIMGQGEGESGIDEKIYIGDNLAIDSASPIISHFEVREVLDGRKIVHARIHDNKSPSLSHEWKSVKLILGEESFPLNWYGEYLWKSPELQLEPNLPVEICATDAAGNMACLKIQ